MNLKIAVLAGDGIGPEISAVGVDVLSAVAARFGHKVTYEYAICGADAIDKVGDPFPEETFQICMDADADPSGRDLRLPHTQIAVEGRTGARSRFRVYP